MGTLKTHTVRLQGLSPAVLSSIFVSLDMRNARAVAGAYTVSDVDDVRFIRAATLGGGYEVERRAAHIESAVVGHCFVCLPLSTSARLRQGRRECVLNPGDIGLIDSRREYTIEVPHGGESIWVRFASSRFDSRLSGPADVFARRIDGRSGIGLLTARFIRSIVDETDCVPPRSRATVASMASDLVAEAAAHVAPATNIFRSGSQRTLERARLYIDRHLEQDDLSPARIAAAIGISARYLGQLFASVGETPMGYVSRRRLQRCRERLERETWRPGLITDMAFACGFANISSFNRAFREAFGMTPRQATGAAAI